MTRAVLKSQRFNATTMRRKTYQGSIWFIWGFGLLFLGMATIQFLRWPRTAMTSSFGFTIGIGFCMGAANSWAESDRFKE